MDDADLAQQAEEQWLAQALGAARTERLGKNPPARMPSHVVESSREQVDESPREKVYKRSLVLYHAGCADGFCAAWVLHRWLWPNAEYRPVFYGSEPPNVAGRNVIIVDFSYPREELLVMNKEARSLRVLDHHKSAAAALEGLDFCTFDMERSGARLAWDFVLDDSPDDLPVVRPWLVNYVEDRDLWRWELPNSREVNAFVRSWAFAFDSWDNLHYAWAEDAQPGGVGRMAVAHGAAFLRAEAQIVDAHVARAREMILAGHKIMAVNASVLQSEIVGQLAKGRPFAAGWWQRADGEIEWTLRSTESGIDVSEVAKQFGGGGHAHAAGFHQPLGDAPHG